MLWPIVIGILVVAMLVGPIMMMQPSKGQLRLAALRKMAATLGLHVNASRIKTPDGSLCWYYWLPLAPKHTAENLVLERKNYAHGMHIADYWAVSEGDKHHAQIAHLTTLLEQLPASVWAFEINAHAIGVHWSEEGGQATLAAFCEQVKKSAHYFCL